MKIEPEGMHFHKPVIVLLSHAAFEKEAYRDYYDVSVEQLKQQWEDLETQRISKPAGARLI